MRYVELRDYLWEQLPGLYDGITIAPGPDLPDAPGWHLILTPSGSFPSSVEGLIDAPGWQVRSVGKQRDYQSAEDLAYDVDRIITSIVSGYIGDRWVVSAYRQGGGPTALETDDAQRHHFVCSYVTEVDYATA